MKRIQSIQNLHRNLVDVLRWRSPEATLGNTLNTLNLNLFIFYFLKCLFNTAGSGVLRQRSDRQRNILWIVFHQRQIFRNSSCWGLIHQLRSFKRPQESLKYSTASLWLMHEVQLQKKHIISGVYIFHFWLLFSSKCTVCLLSIATEMLAKILI